MEAACVSARLVGRDDLIVLKTWAGRPQDLEDVRQLQGTRVTDMKVVTRRGGGQRTLDDVARLQRTLRRVRGGLVRRGVYRFSSFEEADAWMMSQMVSTTGHRSSRISSGSAAPSTGKASVIS